MGFYGLSATGIISGVATLEGGMVAGVTVAETMPIAAYIGRDL